MSKNNSEDYTGAEKDYLVKLLTAQEKRFEKIAAKASDNGEKHIAVAALKQKAEVTALLNKIL